MAIALRNGLSTDDGEDDVYQPLAEINVTPMVDVMLVVLIIFMVITPMLSKSIPVDLALTRNPVTMPDAAAFASFGFTVGLVIGRPVGVLVGFALLGAGLGCVVPVILSAAGAVNNVDTGKAVATVAGCGWAGYVVGPVLIGGIASSTSLHTALFLIPVLTGIVAVATGTVKVLRYRVTG